MKIKLIYRIILLILIISLFKPTYAEDKIHITETLTPSSVIFFIKTSRINKFVNSVNNVIDNLLTAKLKQDVLKERDDFKNKTGIDFLNIDSLSTLGIDIDKAMSLAAFKKTKDNQDRMILFIPILDEKKFPLRFIEIIKNNKENQNPDLYPVITEYRANKMYQVQKDIFFTAMKGYFIIASSVDLIHTVIDLSIDNKSSISANQLYLDYRSKVNQDFDLNLYASREFLEEISTQPKPKKDEKKIDEKDPYVGPQVLNQYQNKNVGYTLMQDSKPEELKKSDPLLNNYSFKSIDYIAFSLGLVSDRIKLKIGSKFNRTDSEINVLIDGIKTGVADKALYVEDIAFYSYFSINFDSIEKICEKSKATCMQYNELKMKFREEFGIDFSKEFLPNYSGVVNIFLGQAKGLGDIGKYLFFLPMNDSEKTRKLWSKSENFFIKKYKDSENFGRIKVGKRKAFWYNDDKKKKSYFLSDTRGLYVSNDLELIKSVLKSKDIKHMTFKNELVKKLDKNVFFLAYINKKSFINALLSMQAQLNDQVDSLFGRSGDIYVVGKKIDQYLSIDFDMEIRKKEKNK